MTLKAAYLLFVTLGALAWSVRGEKPSTKWANRKTEDYPKATGSACDWDLPVLVDEDTFLGNNIAYPRNIFCHRSVMWEKRAVSKRVFKHLYYGGYGWVEKKVDMYLIGPGPTFCPSRTVFSADDCEENEIYIDIKSPSLERYRGFNLRNCQIASCRRRYCPDTQKIWYYDDDGHFTSRCNSRRRLRREPFWVDGF